MVEAGNRAPRLRRMAGLATFRVTIRPECGHPCCKFAFVGVRVTIGTSMPGETERRRRRGVDIGSALVAFPAQIRSMGTCKGEACFHVPRQCERGRTEPLDCVATFAPVLIGRTEELPLVRVGVTGGTGVVREPEPCFSTARLVALGAHHGGVFLRQRESGGGVRGGRERRRFETLHGVTGGTLSAVGAPGELSPVRVARVTIEAAAVGDRELEIRGPVTGLAGHALMLASEGIVRGRMVECRHDLQCLPACRGVTGLAGLMESTLMRIDVTGCAARKCQAAEFCVRSAIPNLRMAFAAIDLRMGTGQHKLRPIMVVLGRILPSGGIVAASTLRLAKV